MMLVYASVISGIVTVPMLFVILKISNDRRILGSRTNGLLSNILGCVTLVIMSASLVAMLAILFLQKMTT